MSMSKTWVITASADTPIEELSRALAKAGLLGIQVLDELGIITGTADENVVPQLRRVPGVIDISEDPTFDVGPPGSPGTW